MVIRLSIGILVLIGLAAYWLAHESAKSYVYPLSGESDLGTSTELSVIDSELPSPELPIDTPRQTVKEKDIAFFMDEGVRHQFQQVAQQYQQDIQFPAYSKPLTRNDWAQLNPRPFVPHRLPLAGMDGLTAEIVLEHFQTTREEGLPILIKVYGDAHKATAAQVILSAPGAKESESVTIRLNKIAGEIAQQWFHGEVSTSHLNKLADGDILVRGFLEFEQMDTVNLSTTFLLSDSVASLTGVDDSYVAGSDLVIPLSFEVKEEGLYRIRANLFDKTTQAPISHLNASFSLSTLNSSGEFHVHASVLRQSGSMGPYILKDFSVIKSPLEPGQKSAYGHTDHAEYEVSGFDLDSYSREEYQDELTKKRLEFLQKMSSQPL